MSYKRALTLLGLAVVFLCAYAFGVAAVSATPWYQPGNALLSPPYAAYSLPFSNAYNSTLNDSYSVCPILPSDFEPVAADLNNDGLLDVITESSGVIYIYDTNCNGEGSITGGYSTQPQIVNMDGSGNLQIAATRGTALDLIKYTNAGISSVTYNYSSASGGVAANYFTCDWSTSDNAQINCLMTFSASRNVVVLNIPRNNATLIPNALSQNTITLSHTGVTTLHAKEVSGAFTPWVGSWTNYRDAYLNLFCVRNGAGSWYGCSVLNSTGALIRNYNYTTTSATLTRSNAFVSPWGNSIYFFERQHYFYTPPDTYYSGYSIFDLTGAAVVNVGYTQDLKASNWVLADYNKDGIDDACIAFHSGASYILRCYATTATYADVNLTSCIPSVNNTGLGMVMADFKPNSSTLGIGTAQGVYYQNGSTCYKWLSSGITDTARNYAPIVTMIPGARQPILIYADSTSGFILRNGAAYASCGNLVCDAYENAYNCPSDCEVVGAQYTFGTGYPCVSNLNCTSGFCSNHKCELKAGGTGCTSGNECLSGVCTNHICAAPSAWQNLDKGKTNTFGNDTETNNMLAIVISIILAGLAALGLSRLGAGGSVSGLLGLVVFMCAQMFFAIVGWLSGFIAFVEVLVVGLGIVASIYFGKGG